MNFPEVYLQLRYCTPYFAYSWTYRHPISIYSQSCSKHHLCIYKYHLLIETVFYGFPDVYFHAIELAYKHHLSIRTTFCWSLRWSLYRNFTVYLIFLSSTHVEQYTLLYFFFFFLKALSYSLPAFVVNNN